MPKMLFLVDVKGKFVFLNTKKSDAPRNRRKPDTSHPFCDWMVFVLFIFLFFNKSFFFHFIFGSTCCLLVLCDVYKAAHLKRLFTRKVEIWKQLDCSWKYQNPIRNSKLPRYTCDPGISGK